MKINPYLEVIIAAIIWGSAGAFVKIIALPPTTLAFFRLAVPSVFFIALFAIQKTPVFHGNNKLILFASTINAARIFLYFVGFTYASINNAIIMFYTWPIFVTLLETPLLKEKTSKKTYAFLLVAFFGILLIYADKEINPANTEFIGITAMLIAAFINAIITIIFKKTSDSYSKQQMVFYQNIIGAVIFLPFLLFTAPFPTIEQTGIAITYATLIGIVAFTLFFSAIKKIKASTASLLSYTEVVSAIIFGVIIFHETLTWNAIAGCVLILASIQLLKKHSQQH